MNGIEIQEKTGKPQGRYRFLSFVADPSVPVEERKRRILAGEVAPSRVSGWNRNLIVSSSGYGLNVICRQLSGDTSIPMAIAEIQIGTGNTAPVAGNTGLQTPVATGILRANQDVNNDEVSLSFFASDLELPNGTYKELGIFAGEVGDRRLFARSIISPDYTKGSAEDTTIEYVIEFTAV
jgi:hypothetical protein